MDNKVKIVLDLLKKFRHSREELLSIVGIGISEEELDFILNGLIEKNFIYKGVDQKYAAIKEPFAVGKLERNNAGQLFVTVNDTDYIIPESKLHAAFKDDIVVIDCTKFIVVGIQKRQNHNLVCDVVEKNNKLALLPFNPPYPIDVRLPESLLAECIIGDRICVYIDDEACNGNVIHATRMEKLGRATDRFADEISIAISRGVTPGFSEEILEEADQYPDDITPEQKKGRVDLTQDQAFTIDSVHTKDMDDALIVRQNSDGTYTLIVNISDVLAVVPANSKLFAEAMRRATSVYIGDYVEPMFPSKISNGICSLNEGKERLTISCEMKFDKDGNLLAYNIYPSVICSKKKMTYEELNHFMDTGEIDESYYPFIESLEALKNLSDALGRNRRKKGMVEFIKDESLPKTDSETGKIEYEKVEHGESEKWIENCMVSANETIALEFIKKTLPLIFRVHEDPDVYKIEKAMGLLESLHINTKDLKSARGRKLLQTILKRYADSEEYGSIISMILLRCMPTAYYSTENIGHWALASDGYCHFTSPIRRLADLIVNLLIHHYIFGEEINYDIDSLISQLDDIAKYCTYKSRQADECERDYEKLKAAKYVEDHFDEEMEVQIVDVKGKCVEVKILANNLKGKLSLGGGILMGSTVTQASKQIVLPRNSGVLMLGDYLIVRPIKYDKVKRETVFEATQFVKRHPKTRKRKDGKK